MMVTTDCLTLHAKHIHVFELNLGLLDHQFEKHCYSVISASEQNKIQRFLKTEDQRRALWTRGLLRLLLSHYLKCDPKSFQFEQNKQGKPYLLTSHNDSIEFNASHSGDWVLLAFNRAGPIGVDIEKINPQRDVKALAEQFAAAGEISALKSLPENQQTAAFFRLWTAKEAVIKALGLGFSCDTTAFEIDFINEGELKIVGENVELQIEPNWLLYSYQPDMNYQACIASQHSDLEVHHIALESNEDFSFLLKTNIS